MKNNNAQKEVRPAEAISKVLTSMVRTENLGIRVTDDGYTPIDKNAKRIKCATEWKNLDAFEELVAELLSR